jgi:hypothetical protein
MHRRHAPLEVPNDARHRAPDAPDTHNRRETDADLQRVIHEHKAAQRENTVSKYDGQLKKFQVGRSNHGCCMLLPCPLRSIDQPCATAV